MRLTFSRSLALLLPLVLLAGCNKSSKNDQRSASGQVLQGTISDDMLPLDKLKSQPPLLAPSEGKSTPEGGGDESSGAASATSETSAEPNAHALPGPSPSSTP